MTIRILLNGAAGKMGRAMAAGILAEQDMQLVAAVDKLHNGTDIGELTGYGKLGVCIEENLAAALQKSRPDVMLDFTSPIAVKANLICALSLSIPCVVGTTGLNEEDLQELEKLSINNKAPLFVAPNFALSAILMMRFAAEAAKYFPQYEIIEMHSEGKQDAPSGTALHTARMLKEQRQQEKQQKVKNTELVSGCRGGEYEETHIHSIRLPGIVAKQEVIFGGLGQRLCISQENIGREGFFPGVALALRSIANLQGLTVGLEKLL